MNTQSTLWAQNNRALDDIKSQLTLLTQTLSNQPKGQFPAQPRPNPIAQAKQVEGSSSASRNVEQEIGRAHV